MRALKYNAACGSVVAGIVLGIAVLVGLLQSVGGATPWYLRMMGTPPAISAAADPTSITNPNRYSNERWSPRESSLKPREYRIETSHRDARHYRTLITKLTLHQGGQIDSRRSRATPHMIGHHRVAIHATAATNEALKELNGIPASDAKARYQWAVNIPPEPTGPGNAALTPIDVYIEGQPTPAIAATDAMASATIFTIAVIMAVGGAVAAGRMDANRHQNQQNAAAPTPG